MATRTDKELLDALETMGSGIGLIHDDNEHWYVSGSGIQSVVEGGPAPFESTFMIDEVEVELAGKTPREAINNFLNMVESEEVLV
jgi:hypothetical protein